MQGHPPPPLAPVLASLGIWKLDRGFGRLGMVWQPDVWAKALRATKLTSFRLCRTKDECESVCSQQPG